MWYKICFKNLSTNQRKTTEYCATSNTNRRNREIKMLNLGSKECVGDSELLSNEKKVNHNCQSNKQYGYDHSKLTFTNHNLTCNFESFCIIILFFVYFYHNWLHKVQIFLLVYCTYIYIKRVFLPLLSWLFLGNQTAWGDRKTSTNERPTTQTLILYDKNLSNTELGDFSAKIVFWITPRNKKLQAILAENSKWSFANLQFYKTNFDRNLATLKACFSSIYLLNCTQNLWIKF